MSPRSSSSRETEKRATDFTDQHGQVGTKNVLIVGLRKSVKIGGNPWLLLLLAGDYKVSTGKRAALGLARKKHADPRGRVWWAVNEPVVTVETLRGSLGISAWRSLAHRTEYE
jgi:hypothetical protein